MKFINPKIDFAFKKIFGSEESHDILVSFLNALIYDGQPIIESLTIVNPYAPSRILALKESYLDVKAKLNDGKLVIIEMQVLNVAAFEKRVIYNAAKAYANQLEPSESYIDLKPVIALTMTDFELFKGRDNAISHFIFQEREEKFEYKALEIELVFVELPKFKKQLEQLENLTDKWIYFMKQAPQLESIPEQMKAVPQIDRAFRLANEANLNRQELADLELQERLIRDRQGEVLFGLEVGLARGLQQGLQQGVREGKVTLILQLLESRLSPLEVGIRERISDLSSEQLERLGMVVLELASQQDLITWLESQVE